MGATPISDAGDIPGREWQIENQNPDFYVLDDWWFGEQMFVRVEVHPSLVTTALLEALATMLRSHTSWAVGLALFHENRGRGYLLVFHDRVMKQGRLFWGKRTALQIAQAFSRFSSPSAA